jgi:hypothetical protein
MTPPLQAAMQYWSNINTLIWQKLATVLALQTGSMIAAFTMRGSLAGILVLLVALFLSAGLLISIKSDIEVRTRLTRQANFISSRLLIPFIAEQGVPNDLKPFVLYNLNEDRRYAHVRYLTGAMLLLGFVVLLDLIAGAILNWPDFFSHLLPTWAFPIFPPKQVS